MLPTAAPPGEEERLQALHAYGVLDTPTEAAFDELVALAARICGAPLSLVTLVDRDRQWFKARHGIAIAETPRDTSFCAQAISHPDELFIVPDAKLDPQFSNNPFVTGETAVRFYAGVPLCTPEGHAVGTLCVLDRQPRTLTAEEQDALRILGHQVVAQLELRRVLKATASRLENSQRIAGVGDWEFDFVSRRLVWSDEIYRILGLTRRDCPPDAENFHRRIHPDDLAFVRTGKAALVPDAPRADFEHRIVRPDGVIRHVHQIVEMKFDEQARPLVELGTLQDITAKKTAEQALRAGEARFRALSESAPLGIFECDPTGLVIYHNRALTELTGRTAAYSHGHGWERSIHPDDRADVGAGWRRAVAEGRGWNEDQRLLQPDGSTRWVHTLAAPCRDATGVLTGFVGTVEDITERRAGELALRESEERFKFVARAVSDVVWDWNLPANSLWWSDGFLTTFGYPAGRLETGLDSWSDHLHPDDRQRTLDQIHHAIDSGAEAWAGEYRFQRHDGAYASVQDRGYILRDAAGAAIRMVGGMRDLTEQKKMEMQYLRAQRMESIGTLAGGIAHDLNNVLAPVMMAIELLKSDLAADPRRTKVLNTIYISCRRGVDLVRQVLSFARGVEGQRIAVRLRHLLTDLETIAGETFPRDIRIAFNLPNDLWPVMGDPSQINQVLLNLAVNARDAMPLGGDLTITASNVTLDDQYSATSPEAKPGMYVLLQVTDTGQGIPPEIRDRIFEPFFTTKETGKGTGLGLSTVHAVIKSHGGFITLESELGVGTTFKVYLPADPALRARQTAPPFSVDLPRGRDELVLVVDDEASICEITRQTLEAFGYRVLTAADGAEALALYAKHASDIAAVVTDMMMPVLDGSTTIRVLQRINPAVKIVAVSGLDATENIARAASLGVRDFLAKPYAAKALLEILREVLDRPSLPAAV